MSAGIPGPSPDAERPSADGLAALDRAIAVLRDQRAALGDAAVDAALAPLLQQRARLAGAAGGEQRKLVTVLFADLVGFTELSAAHDPEDVRTVVDTHFSAWRTAIESAGGTVEKFIGDAVMAVFGLHRSREDDARQAVRAALAMRTSLPRLNESLAGFGVRLAMRVGIDSGDVVVSTLGGPRDQGFVAVGPTVNRASRLQAAADVDGILISPTTYRLVRGWFSLRPTPGLRLKGIEGEVDAWHVASERPRGFRLDRAGGVEGVETDTIGRDVELQELKERFWDVVDDGRWQVVTVLGDAGVGKSRVLQDLDQWLSEQPQSVWWFRGRASPTTQNVPGALLRDVMATRLGIQESDAPDVLRDKVAAGAQAAFGAGDQARHAALVVAAWLGFELELPGGRAAPALPREPQALRDQATARLAGYFARLAAREPVVILLEDVHWADDVSLDWLDAAAPVLASSRVLVVATCRPTLLESRPHWGEGLEHHRRVGLAPLSRRQSRQLVRELLRQVDDLPPAVEELVVANAEGNPFYIEELVTWLIDSGVVDVHSDPWQVHPERVVGVQVPSTLKGVLQARLDALDGVERAVLQRASVVGRVFWDDAVERLVAGGRDQPSEVTLEQLRRRELVFERETSAFESTREFLFKHALLRDVAYDSMLRRPRATYHRLAAQWLAEITAHSRRVDEYAALVAEHFDRAGDVGPAADWYLRAGRQAASVHALAEASRLLGRGVELAGPEPSGLRFDLLAAREQVLDQHGEREPQLADLEAMGSSIPPGDLPREIAWQLARSRWSFAHSEYPEAVAWARTAAESAGPAGLAEAAADATLWWGKALTWDGDGEQARRVLTLALERSLAARSRPLEGEALRYLSMVATNEGRFEDASLLIEQALAVHVADGDTDAQARVLAQTATVDFLLGRYQQARERLEEALPVFQLSGHRYREAIVLGNLGSIAFVQGELAQSTQWIQDAIALSRDLEDLESTATSLTVLGQIHLAVGRLDEAQQALEEAATLAAALDSVPLQIDTDVRLAFVAMQDGRVGDAARLLQHTASLVDRAASPLHVAVAGIAEGRLGLAQGDVVSADRAFDRARVAAEEIGSLNQAREARAGRAACALAGGDPTSAVGLVEPMLEHLDLAGLEGAASPEWVLLTCVEVLEAAGDSRAPATRELAVRYVDERAAATGDEALSAGYLGSPVVRQLRAPSAHRSHWSP